MRRRGAGLAVRTTLVGAIGLMAAVSASATELEEIALMFKGSTITVPRSYGRLVSVVESNQVHYLYFEDAEGVIRILLVGSKGTSLRAAQQFEVLSNTAYILPRENQPTSKKSIDSTSY